MSGMGGAKVGVLALQGDFAAHGRMLEGLGVPWRPVVDAPDLEGLAGLIIPGGESTALLKLMRDEVKDAIRGLAARDGAIYGTCAGALLLAREVRSPSQPGLGLLDIAIERNGYGRQAESFLLRRDSPLVEAEDAPAEMVFIRAPVILKTGPSVKVLAKVRGRPVYVKQGRILATTFHPELTADPSVHVAFLKEIEA